MKQWLKFLLLSPCDRQLLLETFVLLGLVRLGLWWLPFQTLHQLLARISQTTPEPQEVDLTSVSKIVWAVNVASRYMLGGVKCLARALAAQVLLSRRGYSSQLRIGVAKGEKGQLEAHAWVENQGQVVIGYLRDLPRFTPLPSFEGGRL